MKVQYVPGIDVEAALDPDGALWSGATSETVKLLGTPVGLQPTEAIRSSWMTKKIGMVENVSVSAVHDGALVAFHLEWADASENRAIGDTTAFPDAAGILLRSAEGAPSVTMGAPGLAVNAWYWRADEDGGGRQVVAEGLGTTRPVEGDHVKGRGVWRDGRWRVVITRPLKLATAEPVAQLEAGQVTGFGVAIWEGSNGERAGIKAFSGDWLELSLANPPMARR
jgi:complex iron-sulfur molybdoenzyme family reductase subunit gamma